MSGSIAEKGLTTPPQKRDDTAQNVALVLLWTFVISFAVLFVINCWLVQSKADVETHKAWFELLKNASILLGTALTTVIGYYFGQRETALARKEAKNAETRAEARTKEAEAAKSRAATLKEKMDHVVDAIPSGMPADFAASPKRVPKPRKPDHVT